jgi:hypothetical protein
MTKRFRGLPLLLLLLAVLPLSGCAAAAQVTMQVRAVPAGQSARLLEAEEPLHPGDSFALLIDVDRPVHAYLRVAAPGQPMQSILPGSGPGQQLIQPGATLPVPADSLLRVEQTGDHVVWLVASVRALSAEQVTELIEARRGRDDSSAGKQQPPPPPPPPPTPPTTVGPENRGGQKVRAALDRQGIAVLRLSFRSQ